MQELIATLIERQLFNDWAWIVLGAPRLAAAMPGQFVAIRCSLPGSFDPLVPQPLPLAAVDLQAKTCNLLVPRTHPAFSFLLQQPLGATLEVLGPLGKGWQVDPGVRSVALVGTAALSGALFGLAHRAVRQGLAVTVMLGIDAALAAPPPFLLPAATEYNTIHETDAGTAATRLLDDQVLRWADMLAIALPTEQLPVIAQRIRTVRLQWSRGFAQASLLASSGSQLLCSVGVCGVCAIEAKQQRRLICSDGPIFDLRDIVR